MVSDPYFEQTIRQQWRWKLQYQQLPGPLEFKSYSKAVEIRLTPYGIVSVVLCVC